MEQVYLYCRALADRPHSPKDWSRAVKVLDHVSRAHPTPAFAALRHRLSAGLGTEGPVSPPASAGHVRCTGAFLGQRIPARRGGRVRARIRVPGHSARRTMYATRGDRTAEPRSAILRTAPGVPPSGRLITTTTSWSLIPIPIGDITARRPPRMAWAVEPTSPLRPITWRSVSAGARTTRCFTITSPPA